MKVKKKHIDKLELLFVLFMSFALMPDVLAVGGHSLKGMYLMFIVLVGLMANKKRLVKPDKAIVGLFAYGILVSLFASITWGIDRLFFNYCFGFFVIILILSLGTKYTEDDWLYMLQCVWWLLVACVLINDIKQSYRFVEYFQYRLNHPYIVTLVNGGCNIEACWIGILSLSFYRVKKRFIPVAVALGFSLLYASRVGMIATFVVILIFAYGRLPEDTKRRLFNRRVIFTILGITALVMLLVAGIGGGFFLQVFSRFADIGHDPGSLGRLAMWYYVPQTIMEYPFGVGLGNVMPALESVSHLIYEDGNLHNIYMQMFIETGIIGGTLYLFVVVTWCIRNIKRAFVSPIVGMLCIYFVLALFQFRGGDTIFFCLLGIYLNTIKNKQRGTYSEKKISN